MRRSADENLTVYLVLRIEKSSEDQLKAYLPRLKLKLDVWAIASAGTSKNGQSKDEDPGPNQDLIFSREVENDHDPYIIVNADGDDDETLEPTVLAIWETTATLNRPRMRFPSPSLHFIASASLVPQKTAEIKFEDELLPAFEAAQPNLFEPLAQDPAFKNDVPYLPVSRLNRVLPDQSAGEIVQRIRHAPPRSIPAVQAVSARIRYTRLNGSSTAATTLASLDFEITPFVDSAVELEEANLSLAQGSASPVMPLELPLSCRSKDTVTMLYKLQPAGGPAGAFRGPLAGSAANVTNTDAVSISISARVVVSETSNANISMAWTTNIDFSTSLNPTFGPRSQNLQRPNRPNSIPIPTTAQRTVQSAAVSIPRSSILPAAGLTISFCGPDSFVKIGQTFVWTILVVNQSAKIGKLAIIALPQMQRSVNVSHRYSLRHVAHGSTSSTHNPDRKRGLARGTIETAAALCDENIVYALQHQNLQNVGTDLLSLTPEIRVGPLAPGTCHEVELRLLALRPGPQRLEAVRVVDLTREAEEGPGAPGVMVDIRDLPDVFAVDDGATEARDL